MGIHLHGEIEGDKELVQELGFAANKINDFSTPLREIETELLKSVNLNFDTAGRLFVGGWPERKPQYRGGERIDTWPLLKKTGRMLHSFDSMVTASQLVIENLTTYFKYHQSNKPRTRLPRRVMLLIDAARRTFAVKALQRHVVEATRRLRG